MSVPDLSSAQVVVDPSPALYSWTPYSAVCEAMELDHVKVMVDAPVVVTLPNQISSSAASDPANCTPFVQVATPPPETDDTVGVVDPTWAKTTSTSPAV